MNDRVPGRPQPTDDSYIYLLPLDGSTPEVAIVKGLYKHESPMWTPDGDHLLFVSNRSGDWGMWSVALADGALHELRSITGKVEPLGVTRSGSLVYRRPDRQLGVSSFLVSKLDATYNVAAQKAIVGRAPTWSPDGRFIAFLRDPELRASGPGAQTTSLVVHSVATGDEQRFALPGLGSGTNSQNFRWVDDSTHLLVWAGSTVGTEIHRVDLRTRQIDRIPPEPGRVAIAPSGDGRTLFASHSARDAAIGVMATCGTHQLVATDISSGQPRVVASMTESLSLVVSPSNERVFVRSCSRTDRHENGTVNRYSHRLLAVDVITGRQTEAFVVPDTQSIEHVSVSPDGRSLAVVVTDLGSARSNRLFRVDVNDAESIELHVTATPIKPSPVWVGGGSRIRWCEAASLNPCRVMQIDAVGGSPRLVVTDDAIPTQYSADMSHVITVGNRYGRPVTPRGRYDTWAVGNVLSLLRSPR